MSIRTIEDLEAEIRTRTGASLDTRRPGVFPLRARLEGAQGRRSRPCLVLRGLPPAAAAALRGVASLANGLRVNGALHIGTWNVAHASAAKNLQRLALIERANADIWVLKDPGWPRSRTYYNGVHSDPRPRKAAVSRRTR